MTGWAGFWIFCSVLALCDLAVVLTGVDGIFWQYRTPPELRIQQGRLGRQCNVNPPPTHARPPMPPAPPKGPMT